MADKKKTPPRRMRWSVPAADVSTNRWLDAQDDVSASLKELIRESIRRDGYVDAANAPVEQLPRRGRPPMERSTGNDEGNVDEAGKDTMSSPMYMRDELGDLSLDDVDLDDDVDLREIVEQAREAGRAAVLNDFANFPQHEVRSTPESAPEPLSVSTPQSSVPQGLDAFLT